MYTRHLLSHYLNVGLEEMNDIVHGFATEHRWWVATIGEQFLYKKNMSIAKYLSNMKKMRLPADELYVTILARAYEINIGIIMRDYFWTTARQASLADCTIVLGFSGHGIYKNFSFPSLFDTVEEIQERPPSSPAPPEIVQEVAAVLANLRYPTVKRCDDVQDKVEPSAVSNEDDESVVQSGNASPGHIPSGTETGDVEEAAAVQSGNSITGDVNGIQSGTETGDVQEAAAVQSGNSITGDVNVVQSSTETGDVQEAAAVQSGNVSPGHVPSGTETGDVQSGNGIGGDSAVNVQSGNVSPGHVPSGTETGDVQSGNGIGGDSAVNVQSGNASPGHVQSGITDGDGTRTVASGKSLVLAGTKGRKTRNSRKAGILGEALGVSDIERTRGRQTKNSQAAGLVDPLPPSARAKRPSDLTERDPIGDAIGGMSPLPSHDDGSTTEEDTRVHTPPPSKKIKTDGGQLKITDHAIRRPKKKILKLKCPVTGCDVRSDSEASRNKHVADSHPDHKFQCSHCGKVYATSNGLWKHTNKHFAPSHVCPWEDCNRKCYYKSELKTHIKTHTQEGLIQCTWRGCDKKFVSNKSMYGHLESHNDRTFYCEDCERVFQTKYLYKQHMVGKHSDKAENPESVGLVAKCGKLFKWPEERARHQENCDDCKKFFEHLATLPQKPKKIKCEPKKDNDDGKTDDKQDETEDIANGNKDKTENENGGLKTE